MYKPKVVYHGSQYKFDVLMPRQANGQCEVESKMGVYAASTMEEVIPLHYHFVVTRTSLEESFPVIQTVLKASCVTGQSIRMEKAMYMFCHQSHLN